MGGLINEFIPIHTYHKLGGRKPATTDWAYRVGSSSGLITIVVMTLLETTIQFHSHFTTSSPSCQTPGDHIGNCQAVQSVMVWPCMCHNTLPWILAQGTMEGGRLRGRSSKCWWDNIWGWSRQSLLSVLYSSVRLPLQKWCGLGIAVNFSRIF